MPEILQLNPENPVTINVAPEKMITIFDCENYTITFE